MDRIKQPRNERTFSPQTQNSKFQNYTIWIITIQMKLIYLTPIPSKHRSNNNNAMQ
ncbi:hypothetical protein CsatB_020607 [Cannabis sativa]